MVSSAPRSSNAAKSTAYEIDIVDPLLARGRLTLRAEATDEHTDDVRAFRVGEGRQALSRGMGDRHGGVQELDVARPDRAAGRRQRRTRDRAFELANVARPVIGTELIDGFARKRFAVERKAL